MTCFFYSIRHRLDGIRSQDEIQEGHFREQAVLFLLSQATGETEDHIRILLFYRFELAEQEKDLCSAFSRMAQVLMRTTSAASRCEVQR